MIIDMLKIQIADELKERAKIRLKQLKPFFDDVGFEWLPPFKIAGGSMAGNLLHDIDLFGPSTGWGEDFEDELSCSEHIISATKNTTTLKYDDLIVQVCCCSKPSLQELVESFDFTHIQAGARCSVPDDSSNYPTPTVDDVYFTDAFVLAKTTSKPVFSGSEYPLSSLVRTLKYFRYGDMTRGTSIAAVIGTLVAILKRGFTNYADFKDQLDAVDLGLIPEELKDIERAELMELYNLLTHDPKDKE